MGIVNLKNQKVTVSLTVTSTDVFTTDAMTRTTFAALHTPSPAPREFS